MSGGWAGRVRFSGSADGLRLWLRGCVTREIDERRLFPWLAVAFGCGIVLAFAADGPLSPWPPISCALGCAALAWAGRGRLGRLAPALAAAALFAGFASVTLRLRAVEAPVLPRLTIGPVSGFVESLEQRAGGGGRIVLRVTGLAGQPEAERPRRVRLTARSVAGVAPGDYVAGSARLLPPPEAARPGGYDFARDAYFRGIGAVGSVSGQLKRSDAPSPPGFGLLAAAAVDRARNALTDRIASAIGGQAGAVSAALVTGKRGLIDERTNDILRAAGIYHVVSISGLHMVLAAGVFFWLSRALLALSPAAALGWPIKKVAAGIGMAGASAYCVFSGAEVATERALVMILVMQGAILFDRLALSMRNLALAALIVLAREPEALLGPSFQMSYGAVAGLIAFAETLRRLRPSAEPGDLLGRFATWAVGLVLVAVGTTLIATLATGPFAAFHFQTLQPYGLIGNIATLPLISLAVMPAAVLGVLAFPFGLDRPVWLAMGYATEGVLRLSEWVAGFGGSTAIIPAFGGGALAAFALALLCASLLASGLRWIALAPAMLGLLLAAAPSRPDIYVARDGSGAAVRVGDGRLAVIGRVPAFTVEQWLKADGDRRRPGDPSLTAPARCDPIGCVVIGRDGRAASHLVDRRGFASDCGRAAVIVTRLQAPAGCQAAQVFDRRVLMERGASTIAVNAAGYEIRSTRRPDETRPWLVRSGEALNPKAPQPARPDGAARRFREVPPPAGDALPAAEPPDSEPQ